MDLRTFQRTNDNYVPGYLSNVIIGMWMYVVGAGVILYTIPYYCLNAVFRERMRKGWSPRGSSMSLRKIE